MMRALWIAQTGLNAQQNNLDVISNNIANISTNAFKRARVVFEDLVYQTVRQAGAQSSQQTQIPAGLQFGTGAKPVATVRVHTQGNLQQTTNSLDVAIQGEGFFQVLMPDGTTAYTRDGSFQRDSTGQLVTANGYPIQPAITIPVDALTISIGGDGTVSVTQAGVTGSVVVGNIQLATFPNVGGLQNSGQNLYLETASSGAATPNTPGTGGAGTINQQFVETSNVNIAEELVNLIQAQRGFEFNSRVIQTSDSMLGRLAQL